MTQLYVLWLLQAVTECLPISSSGHLALAQAFLPARGADHAPSHLSQKAYMLAHMPALVAGLWYTYNFWWPLFTSLLVGGSDGLRAVLFFSITTLCAVVGYIAHRFAQVRIPLWIGFIITAVMLVAIGKLYCTQGLLLSMEHALVIGVAQAMVFVPGVSRLATVTLVGSLLGYSPYAAYCLAWLVHLPLMAGGMLTTLVDNEPLPVSLDLLHVLGMFAVTLVACLLVYLVGWLAVMHKLWFFSWYLCIPIASAWYKRREIV